MKLEPSAELTCLSNDFTASCGAVNLGKPLAQFAPRSDFRHTFRNWPAGLSRHPGVGSVGGALKNAPSSDVME